MKKLTFSLIASFIVLTFFDVVAAYAQMAIPVGPGDADANTTPIGGIAIFAAAGGGYALKKLWWDKRQ